MNTRYANNSQGNENLTNPIDDSKEATLKLKMRLNHMENYDSEVAASKLIEDDSESSQKFDDLDIIESVSKDNTSNDLYNKSLKQKTLNSKDTTINDSRNTLKKEKSSRIVSTGKTFSRKVEINKPEVKKSGTSRLVKVDANTKFHKSIALDSSKSKEEKTEVTNTTIESSTRNVTILYNYNHSNLTPRRTEDSKKLNNENIGITSSVNTSRGNSILSSQQTYLKSDFFDSNKVLERIKEKYKNINICYTPLNRPETTAVKVIKVSSPTITPAKPSQSSEVKIEEPPTIMKISKPIIARRPTPLLKSNNYHQQVRDFLRLYVDNRLPNSMKSYRSSSQVFKARFCQRFYGGNIIAVEDDDVAMDYYNRSRHAPLMSNIRSSLRMTYLGNK